MNFFSLRSKSEETEEAADALLEAVVVLLDSFLAVSESAAVSSGVTGSEEVLFNFRRFVAGADMAKNVCEHVSVQGVSGRTRDERTRCLRRQLTPLTRCHGHHTPATTSVARRYRTEGRHTQDWNEKRCGSR